MRAILPFLVAFFYLAIGFSQTPGADTSNAPQPISKNELRLNVTNFILLNAFTVDYERLITDESSVGISLLFGLGNTDDFDQFRNFELTPYYRQFFSKKYARGFFIEGFASVLNREDVFFGFDVEETMTETNVALGISVGGKFLTRGGFVAEVFLGVGRTLFDNDDFFFESVIGRGGISLGYRF